MADGKPSLRQGTMGRLLEEGDGQAKYHVAGVCRRVLCFGWIDGLRKRIDEASYKIRFSPRKPSSNWSAVNVRRVETLMAEGRMMDLGLQAFRARLDKRSSVYSYEQRPAELDAKYLKQLRRSCGMDVLPDTTALLSQSGQLVDRQRETRGDSPATTRAIDC